MIFEKQCLRTLKTDERQSVMFAEYWGNPSRINKIKSTSRHSIAKTTEKQRKKKILKGCLNEMTVEWTYY